MQPHKRYNSSEEQKIPLKATPFSCPIDRQMGAHHSVSDHLVTEESGYMKFVGRRYLSKILRRVKRSRPLLWDMYRASSFGFAANGLLMFALSAMLHDITFHEYMLPWWLEALLLIVQSVLSYMADVVCEFEERRVTSKWYRLDRMCAVVLLTNSVGRMIFGNLPYFQRLISATGFIGVFCYFREIHFLMRKRLIPAMKYHTCWHFSMCATAMAFNLWSVGCQYIPRISGSLQPLGMKLWVGCLVGLDEHVIGSATNAEQLAKQYAATINSTISSTDLDGIGSTSFRVLLFGLVIAGFFFDCAFPSDPSLAVASSVSKPREVSDASKRESSAFAPSCSLAQHDHSEAWSGTTGG
jgi:hypothetical protein